MGLLALLQTGCVTATPVIRAPIGPEDAPKLRAALVGSCEVKARQTVGGELKPARGLHLAFLPESTLRVHAETPFGDATHDYRYQMDGRNIVDDGPFKTIRVDDWSGHTLKLFMYDISETYYCERE